MAADILYINDKYLEKANYNFCLGDNLHVASYQIRILLGPIQFDEVNGKARFSKKSATIPSSQYVDFVRVVERANASFDAKDSIPWETVLYKFSKTHHLIAKFDIYEEEPVFKLLIKWNFDNDRSWKKLVDQGNFETF